MNGVSLADTLHALEQFAPPLLAESWDRSGLQVGDPQALVRRVLIALDPSAETIAEASRRKADLIVTHHPLFLKSPESFDLSRPANRVAASLIREGIALYTAHTNYDRAEGGVNDLLARKLGLEDVRPLGKGEGLRKVVVTVPAGHENAVRSAMAEAGGDVSARTRVVRLNLAEREALCPWREQDPSSAGSDRRSGWRSFASKCS